MQIAPATNPYAPIKFSAIPAKPLDWLWPHRIPYAKLSLLLGHPGTGKTSLALHLASQLSRAEPIVQNLPPKADGLQSVGPPPLCIMHSELCIPRATLLLSPEDNLADTLRPRLDAMHANLDLIHSLPNFHSLIPTQNQSPLDLLDAALSSIPNLALLIIDPITHYLGLTDHQLAPPKKAQGSQSLGSSLAPRSILHALSQLAEKHHIAILLTARLAKNTPPSQDLYLTLHRLLGGVGSLAFPASARTVHLLLPYSPPTPENPSPESPGIAIPGSTRPAKENSSSLKQTSPPAPSLSIVHSPLCIAPNRLLLTMKNNLSTPTAALPFTLTNKITWSPESIPVPTTFIPKARPKPEPKPDTFLNDAVDLLKTALATGPERAANLYYDAKRIGISQTTLRRAKDFLQLKTQFSYQRDAWFWSFKDDNRPIPTIFESLEKEMSTSLMEETICPNTSEDIAL